jgi:hypothetical protein
MVRDRRRRVLTSDLVLGSKRLHPVPHGVAWEIRRRIDPGSYHVEPSAARSADDFDGQQRGAAAPDEGRDVVPVDAAGECLGEQAREAESVELRRSPLVDL